MPKKALPHAAALAVWIAAVGATTAGAQITAMPLTTASPVVPDNFLTAPPSSRVPLIPPFGSDQGVVGTAETRSDSAGPGPLAVARNVGSETWTWQGLPSGLIYPSYLAGGREPRMAFQGVDVTSLGGWYGDATLGARVGLIRYGTEFAVQPEGWQLDVEGAAFPRLNMDTLHLVSSDFRYGMPLCYRQGIFETKFAFYHESSHLSDIFMAQNPGSGPNWYSRYALVWGVGVRPLENLRTYAEIGWSFCDSGPTKPWECQFGVDWAPAAVTDICGAPFFAVNVRLRQEVDYGGNLTVQGGWAWRGRAGQLFRVGLDYFNGESDQVQFLNQFEQQIGAGVWYDF